MIPLIRGSYSSQNHRDRKQNGCCQRLLRERKWGVIIYWVDFQFCKMKRVMEINGGDGCTTL